LPISPPLMPIFPSDVCMDSSRVAKISEHLFPKFGVVCPRIDRGPHSSSARPISSGRHWIVSNMPDKAWLIQQQNRLNDRVGKVTMITKLGQRLGIWMKGQNAGSLQKQICQTAPLCVLLYESRLEPLSAVPTEA
jgi:hypothetical protein